MSSLDAQEEIGLLHPSLVQLTKDCLHNMPHQRPHTEDVLARLQVIQMGGVGENFVSLDMVRVRLTKDLKLKERRIEELTLHQVNIYIMV